MCEQALFKKPPMNSQEYTNLPVLGLNRFIEETKPRTDLYKSKNDRLA